MGRERAESRRVTLLGVLIVKDGLDRTGKKSRQNLRARWSVPPDALPGSATIDPLPALHRNRAGGQKRALIRIAPYLHMANLMHKKGTLPTQSSCITLNNSNKLYVLVLSWTTMNSSQQEVMDYVWLILNRRSWTMYG
jgi:hypothetical protein